MISDAAVFEATTKVVSRPNQSTTDRGTRAVDEPVPPNMTL